MDICTLHWVDFGQNTIGIGYYGSKQKVIQDISDYSIYLSFTQGLKKNTVQNETRFVFTFLKYLRSSRRLVSSVDDDTITRFRDIELENVTCNPIWRGDIRTAKRTVNAKLRRIYWFLWWYQWSFLGNVSLIGPQGCQVTSSLQGDEDRFRNFRRYPGRGFETHFLRMDERFPLCFRNTGKGLLHRTQRVPTIEGIKKLRDVVGEGGYSFVTMRNLLFLEISEQTGLRREALTSLRIDQFANDVIENAENGVVPIIADLQKFSYQNISEFSIPLACNVLHFIEAYLLPLYEIRRWNKKIGEGKIFVSERTGRPLDPSTFTQIFGLAFKEIGGGKGSAVHILRHHFTNRAIAEEIRFRIKHKMDTSLSSICAAVSLKLGQKNPDSIRPYVSKVISQMFHELETNEIEANKNLRTLTKNI